MCRFEFEPSVSSGARGGEPGERDQFAVSKVHSCERRQVSRGCDYVGAGSSFTPLIAPRLDFIFLFQRFFLWLRTLIVGCGVLSCADESAECGTCGKGDKGSAGGWEIC